jgi:hypothetical protein
MSLDPAPLRKREVELGFAQETLMRQWRQLAADYEDAEDLDAARRCLEHGLVLAERSQDCTSLANRWRALDDEAGSNTHRCLAKARALAGSHHDWFVIAECVYELKLASPRPDLERAESCPSTAAERRRLARAVRGWLGDDAWSARLGPRGVSPAVLTLAGCSRWGVERDAAALFDWLRERVADADLVCIAAADGGYDEAEHLEVLRDIRDTGLVPSPMQWCPNEVAHAASAGWCGVSPIASAFCSALLVLSCLGRLEPGDDRSWLPGVLAAMLDSPNELHERERAAAAQALQQLGFVAADPSG